MSKQIITDALDEIFNEDSFKEIEFREEIRGDSETEYWNNKLFVCDDTDTVNKVIKNYLTNKGLNVITVSPTGYEIQRKKCKIRLMENLTICDVIQPGDEMVDNLKKENTVLLLPDLDKMSDSVYRAILIDMIRTHIVADPRNGEDGFAKLHFTFVAIATVGEMPITEFSCLTRQDAKGCFRITKTYE